MNVKKTRVSLLVAILTVALMFSLFAVSAFAETEGTESVSEPASVQSSPISSDESTPAGSEESTPASSGSASTTAPSNTTAATTTDGHDHDHDHGEKDPMDTIISLIVGGVIIIAIVVVCIIMREKLGKFMRSLKSELGKIVWLPKNQTIKNTVVVLIIVAACAILIGIVDAAFGNGIRLLGKLF